MNPGEARDPKGTMVSMYFVRQPNGLLARFSTRAGLLYEVDLSEADALAWYRRRMTDDEAPAKVRRAVSDEPIDGGSPAPDRLGRWRRCLDVIRAAHGPAAVALLLADHPGVFEPADGSAGSPGSEVLATHLQDKEAILELVAGRERDVGGEG
jgi:hypothetical protein